MVPVCKEAIMVQDKLKILMIILHNETGLIHSVNYQPGKGSRIVFQENGTEHNLSPWLPTIHLCCWLEGYIDGYTKGRSIIVEKENV